ncbi:MAG TPA: hypothetical protein VHI52_21405 [Verrucomicrobiae bacterium]|jgi:hypothetical protein|nr:hypothetical protein [Verrucomicrobiae bacterium]
MKGTFNIACVLSGATILAACANFSELQKSETPTISDIIDNIECDLATGVRSVRRETYPDIMQWNVLFSLTLQTDTTNKGESSLSVEPAANWGHIKIGLGGSASRKTTSTRNVDYSLPLSVLVKRACGGEHRKVAGTIGAGLWLEDVFAAFARVRDGESPGGKGFSPPKSLNTMTKFVIDYTGNTNPAFSMVSLGSSVTGISATLSGEWANTNTVNITISPPAKPEAAAPKHKGKAPARIRSVSPRDENKLENDQGRFLLQQILPQVQ